MKTNHYRAASKAMSLLAAVVGLLVSSANPAWAYSIDAGATNFWFLDAADQGCNAKSQCCTGLVTWSVSEPYVNLWLGDEPVGYTTSLGQHIGFQLFYKQRDTRPPGINPHQKWYLGGVCASEGCGGGVVIELPPPKAQVPPTGWNHSWFS